MDNMAKIEVYLDDGRVFTYLVESNNSKVREHHHAIITGGYRSCRGGVLESFPPHRIVKVKTSHPLITSDYPDDVRGT